MKRREIQALERLARERGGSIQKRRRFPDIPKRKMKLPKAARGLSHTQTWIEIKIQDGEPVDIRVPYNGEYRALRNGGKE